MVTFVLVIEAFSCKETEKIWNGGRSRKLPGEIKERAFLNIYGSFMRPMLSPICGSRPATAWKLFPATSRASGVCESINSGAWFSGGMTEKRPT
jgi:hypothetical protein